jgi:hypothetical protein
MNTYWTRSGFAFCLAASAAVGAEKPQTIPPERLANYWLLLSGTAKQTNAPNSGRNLDAPTCASVSYIVEKDGTTSNVELKRLVPEGDLGKVAVSVVKDMRFTAAPDNPGKTPVYTYVTIPFNLPGANATNATDLAQRKSALDACKLEGFGGKETFIPVR